MSDLPAVGTPARQTDDSRMNLDAFQTLIADDLAWLEAQPHSLERSHIREIVRNCWRHYYPEAVAEPTPPSTGRPDEKCWLIEWPGKVVCWFTGERFSVNATDAKRFSSKAEAEQGIREMVSYGIARQCIATEHIFISPLQPVSGEGTGTLTRYLTELAAGVLRLTDLAVQRLASELLVELLAKDAQLAELHAEIERLKRES